MKIALVLFSVFLVVSLLMYLLLTIYSAKKRITNRVKEFLPTSQVEEAAIQKEKNYLLVSN